MLNKVDAYNDTNTSIIIEANEKCLQKYLYNSLKNQCTWRDNKSDALNDQLKFFESYLGKEAFHSHIDKELITNNLAETDPSSKINTIKNKFVNIIPLSCQFENLSNFMVCYFDTENSNTNSNFITFDMKKQDEESETLMKDELRLNLNFDTNLRASRHIQNTDETISNIIAMDMYSIYNIDILIQEDLELSKFDKSITLDEIPNFFLSEFLCDKFFITSHSEINSQNNSVNLISRDFKIVSKKTINNSSGGLKGEFINHPMNILIHSQDSIFLIDFRSPSVYEKRINSQILNKISEIKLTDDFKYLTFSNKTISLYDLRYPQIPISHFPLNINWPSLEMSKVVRNYSDSFDRYTSDYLSWNASKKENSLMLFNILDIQSESGNNTMNDFFSDFIEVKLFYPKFDVHDSSGILIDKTLHSFYADNLGGLYYSHFSILTQDCTKTFQQDYDENIKENKDINNAIFAKDTKILECYEAMLANSLYKETKTNPKLKYANKTSEVDKLSSDSEIDEYIADKTDSEANFGTARVKGISKKMYTIESGRKILKSLIETEIIKDDVKMEDNKEDISVTKNNEVDAITQSKEELDWLFEALDDNLQYYK